MDIRWYGHSCFLMSGENGVMVLTDPYGGNFPMPAVRADIVTTSHKHWDHCAVDGVKGEFILVDKCDATKVWGIDIRGVRSYHDDAKGTKRGENLIFIFDIDGVKVCHLGDIGEDVTEEMAAKIGNIDVLLVPVGGKYTIDATQAMAFVQRLKPRYVFPMHYFTEKWFTDVDKVDKFLAMCNNYDIVRTHHKVFSVDHSCGKTQIVLLEKTI